MSDGRTQVHTDKLNHRRYDDGPLRELGFRLGLDKAQVRQRGHEWDVADIMAVVEAWQDEQP